MSALLHDGPLSPALVVSRTRDGQAPLILSAYGARRLTDEIRTHLGSAIVKLAQAREGGADTALGYDTWHEYVEAEFGDLRELRLPVAERRALVGSMTEAGLSVRAIRDRTDYSLGTIHGDRQALGLAPARPLPEPVDPYAGMTRTAETLARVAAQGDRGLTSIELDHETGWPMGTATATLSRLERRGLVHRTAVFRQRRAAYVTTTS